MVPTWHQPMFLVSSPCCSWGKKDISCLRIRSVNSWKRKLSNLQFQLDFENLGKRFILRGQLCFLKSSCALPGWENFWSCETKLGQTLEIQKPCKTIRFDGRRDLTPSTSALKEPGVYGCLCTARARDDMSWLAMMLNQWRKGKRWWSRGKNFLEKF